MIDAYKMSVITDMFVYSADENYITARWCAMGKLNTDYLWMAAHSVEKYSKAVLLANGHSSLSFNHNLINLFRSVKNIAGDLMPDQLTMPAELVDEFAGSDIFWNGVTTERFFARLNDNGDPNNRYRMLGYDYRPSDIFQLDSVVFALRRLVTPLDQSIEGVPYTNRQILASKPRYKNQLGLPLDKALADLGLTEVSKAALTWNYEFAPKDYEHPPLAGHSASSSSVLLRRVLDPLDSSNRDVAVTGIETATWVLANIFIPGKGKNDGVHKQISDAITKAKTTHSLP